MNRRHSDNWAHLRAAMVEEQIRRRGVRDSRVLEVMRELPRHEFVPPDYQNHAYEDRPLPIGYGQTISQPYIVALMTEKLRVTPTTRVLEIGTGCGYQTAILAKLAAEVYSIERIKELSRSARENLRRLGIDQNVHLKVGDGSLGWPEMSPFDRIMVTAAAQDVPPSLMEQLGYSGVMVIPIGGPEHQTLTAVTKERSGIKRQSICLCRFVKLLGEEGFRQ